MAIPDVDKVIPAPDNLHLYRVRYTIDVLVLATSRADAEDRGMPGIEVQMAHGLLDAHGTRITEQDELRSDERMSVHMGRGSLLPAAAFLEQRIIRDDRELRAQLAADDAAFFAGHNERNQQVEQGLKR